MPSLITFIRQDLRAALVASLLVLAHALLLTASKAPLESRTDELVKALGTISALTSVTILWVTFTILEAADGIRSIFERKKAFDQEDNDEGEEEEEGGERYIFCMTWIELVFGLGLLAIWTYYHPQAELILSAFASTRTTGLILIRIAYIVALSSLALLQLHLILSITWHAFWQGGVMSSHFWNDRTGWWVGVGKIRLESRSSKGNDGMEEKV